jgi:hypothetical protein
MEMDLMTKCDYCEKEAVVKLNSAWVCQDHLNEKLGGLKKVIDDLRRLTE